MLRNVSMYVLALSLAATACAEGMRVEVRAAGGEVVAATSLIDGDIDAEARGPVAKLTTRRKGDKRRYLAQGAEVAEVKIAGDGFKVKAPGGELRWKVKVHGDKIKVGSDELMTDAWELRTYADHVKVKKGETEVARIAVDLAKNALKVEANGAATEYKVAAPRLTAGFAVLALPAADVDRAILMSEIIALGK